MIGNSIYKIVKETASDLDSLYKGSGTDRKNLMDFFEVNNWFGIVPGMRYGIPMVTEHDIKRFNDPLTLWLAAYRKPGRDKINLMLQYFSEIYPMTCRLYREFLDYRNNIDEPTAWKLLDYLLSEIDSEITEYNESDIETMIKSLEMETTLTVALMFGDFLCTAKHNGKPLTRWAYSFDSRDYVERDNSAYGMDEFAVMAYCVFNEDMWVRQDLIAKAVRSKKYADLWLFVALHFICALRISDMKRLPAPALPYDGSIVLEKVLLGTFEKQKAYELVDELMIRLKLKPMKPSKTAAHEGVPDLKLFVPESLKTPLGIIMAISLAHHSEIKPGDGFVSPSYTNLNVIESFFGRNFTSALDNRQFTSLRCNKSYLQGIDNIAGNDNEPGKPKGYILAALARSHKGGIGTLAKATDIYLKDARFSGYNPEFIMREMFERGVFSFIPAILLEMYAGKEYITLPVRLQTKLIGEVGLAAHQIEWMTATADRVLERSRQAVNSVLQKPDNIHESIFYLLQNIASGNAPGRQEECLCLKTAAGLACSFIDRDTCIGCGYEIYTKAAIHTLMKEYSRLYQQKKNAPQAEGEHVLTVRRTRLKGGFKKVAYRISEDYEYKKYIINESLAAELRSYIKSTDKMNKTEIDTLFLQKPHFQYIGTKVPSKNRYYNYDNLRICLSLFYQEVVALTDNIELDALNLGDTRHLAMTNLIISGGSPVICKELAGHLDIDISSHYYSNISYLVECVTLERYRKSKGASAEIVGNSKYAITLPESRYRLSDGWCDATAIKNGDISECLKVADKQGQIGNCDYCIHFWPDKQGIRMKFLDDKIGKQEVEADCRYLIRMIESVRKGLGYSEDIGAALLRLQRSSNHYGKCLWDKYTKAGEK